jgi:hypothetical protein
MSVNVLSTVEQPDNSHILYSSHNLNRLHQVNLLLLKSNSRLRAFSYSADLEIHKTYCRTNARQQLYYPNPTKEE